jgi:osmotically-inducible protein OsmY
MDLEYQYLVGRLQEALAADARVSSLDIKVKVTGGTIHLMGEVPTEERRSALADVAAAVLPGTPVRNDVTVLGALAAPVHERIA